MLARDISMSLREPLLKRQLDERRFCLPLFSRLVGDRCRCSAADRLLLESKRQVKIELDERDVERAAMHYAVSKLMLRDSWREFDFDVTVHWRGKSVTVEVRRKVPTLTDRVEA
jgi:hypothetical protein